MKTVLCIALSALVAASSASAETPVEDYVNAMLDNAVGDAALALIHRDLQGSSVIGTVDVGGMCGLKCAQCTLPTDPGLVAAQTCMPGLMCLYNPDDCNRRYQGVCVKPCNAPGRTENQCTNVGDHCVWFENRQKGPQCQGDGGCRLDPKYVYNPEGCSLFKCEGSCNNSGGCVWQSDTSTCTHQWTVDPNGLARENTPTCWLAGTYTVDGVQYHRNQKCGWAKKNSKVEQCQTTPTSEYEYEYEINGSGGPSSSCTFAKGLKHACFRITRRSRCNKAAAHQCDWRILTKLPQCRRDHKCVPKGSCFFQCKLNCDKFKSSCKWTNFGCKKKGC